MVNTGIDPTKIGIFPSTAVVTVVPVIGGGISPWFGSLAILLSPFSFLIVYLLVFYHFVITCNVITV